MTQKNGSIGLAWKSASGKKIALSIAAFSLSLLIGLAIFQQNQESQLRTQSITQFARTLAATTLSAGGEADDILLKVNDLLNVDAVLGVRLLKEKDIPLSVGEIKNDFPPEGFQGSTIQQWSMDQKQMDLAFRLDPSLPFDTLVMRIDSERLGAVSSNVSLYLWLAAPFIAFTNGLICLFMMGRATYRPYQKLKKYFKDHASKFATSPMPQDLFDDAPDYKALGNHIEAMRTEILKAKDRAEFQARFLHETPYPLIRCSVNRKVMYANVSARALSPLFGDNSKEFVSPAVSELIRKSFQDAKQIYGDIRCNDTIITFRAIPVLDTGYVNLYGEVSRRIDEDI